MRSSLAQMAHTDKMSYAQMYVIVWSHVIMQHNDTPRTNPCFDEYNLKYLRGTADYNSELLLLVQENSSFRLTTGDQKQAVIHAVVC